LKYGDSEKMTKILVLTLQYWQLNEVKIYSFYSLPKVGLYIQMLPKNRGGGLDSFVEDTKAQQFRFRV
jgi:hypothetical protein